MKDRWDRANILIVDDVESNLLLLKRIIEEMGYLVQTALNVEEAIVKLGETMPELILTDLTMPEIDGYQFISMLKENAITRTIPIIIISALSNPEEKQRGFQLGAVDYITKPYNRIEVETRVRTHLKMHQMQLELEGYTKKLNITIEQQYKKIEFEQKNILIALAQLIEKRTGLERENHLENVAYNAQLLAQSLSFSPKYENYITQDYIETIQVAALLHDIGKMEGGAISKIRIGMRSMVKREHKC